MTKFLTIMSVAIFLSFSGSSVFAESGMGKQKQQSQSMGDQKNKGTSQATNPKERDAQEQEAAQPGVAGEEGETSMFGSPATLPPGEHSPGYTGADKKAEEMDREIKKEREQKGKSSQ